MKTRLWYERNAVYPSQGTLVFVHSHTVILAIGKVTTPFHKTSKFQRAHWSTTGRRNVLLTVLAFSCIVWVDDHVACARFAQHISWPQGRLSQGLPLLHFRPLSSKAMLLTQVARRRFTLVGLGWFASSAYAALYTDPAQLPTDTFDFVVVGGKHNRIVSLVMVFIFHL